MSKYRHYKNGKLYEVWGTAISETNKEALILYSEVGGNVLWARPAEEFFGTAYNSLGNEVPRFEEVSDAEL